MRQVEVARRSSFGIPMIESAESRFGTHLTVNGDLTAKRHLFSEPIFSLFADRSAIIRSARRETEKRKARRAREGGLN